MSRIVRITAWRVLARSQPRPYKEHSAWTLVGVTPGALVVAIAVSLVLGLFLGVTVR